MFGKKKGRFRPAGGEIFFRVCDRVSRVTYPARSWRYEPVYLSMTASYGAITSGK